MAQIDVERTLKEIRERVRVQLNHQATQRRAPCSEADQPEANSQALESLRANLAVVERTWNRLPPLTSYRKGWLSRLELWFKRRLKRAVHWFTWEQVNFNAATANSLKEILSLLSDYEHALLEQQAQLEQISERLSEMKTEGPTVPTKAAEGSAGMAATNGRQFGAEEKGGTAAGILSDSTDLELERLASRIEQVRSLKARE